MLNTVDEIIAGFEQALELERELGTRYVEMPVVPAMVQPQAGRNPVSTVDKIERTGGHPPSPPPQLNRQVPTTNHRSPITGHQELRTRNREPITDFAFIVYAMPQGAAADMLAKMVAAMGYAMSQVTVVTAQSAREQKPQARVYVVLGGTDAFRTFAPGQRAALGLWTSVNDVPTIITYSPARILLYFGNDPAGLTKAKRQIWSDLKSALAHIGKKPPTNSARHCRSVAHR